MENDLEELCLRDEICRLHKPQGAKARHSLMLKCIMQVTKEGELLPFFQQELTVGADGSDDRLMFIWPTLIVHKIDEDSPLYNLTAQDMIKDRFEIVTMLEGVVESTGMTTQARSSYLPAEILWGHRFESTVSFKRETGEYEVSCQKTICGFDAE